MRQKFNRLSLCSHTTPDGKSIQGRGEILRKKFESCDITRQELREYVSFVMISDKQPEYKTITLFGVTKKVTMEEYNNYYKPCGF